MKTFILLATALFSIACAKTVDPADFGDLFTLKDAEMILGEPAKQTEDAGTTGEVARHHATFMANDTDAVSHNLGAIYYLAERFPDISAAQVKYVNIYEANAGHDGIKVLEGLGDEAYFHSDNTNFLFIMARKGRDVLTMKVNKLTSHTSREAFDRVAQSIVGRMGK